MLTIQCSHRLSKKPDLGFATDCWLNYLVLAWINERINLKMAPVSVDGWISLILSHLKRVNLYSLRFCQMTMHSIMQVFDVTLFCTTPLIHSSLPCYIAKKVVVHRLIVHSRPGAALSTHLSRFEQLIT